MNEPMDWDYPISEHCTLNETHETHDHDDSDPEYCCNCGHFHNDYITCPEEIPCGDSRCCIN